MVLVHRLTQEAIVGVWTTYHIFLCRVALEVGVMPVGLHGRMEGLVQHKSTLVHCDL